MKNSTLKTLSKLFAATAFAASTLCVAETASAYNYSLYLHGYTGLSGYSAPSGWQYWNNSGVQPGINAVPVNYDGTQHISQSNVSVRSALDAYCLKGSGNTCYIAAHSMGAAQIGYAVSNYPSRWDIYWVLVGGGAEGGSELANAADWLLGDSSTQSALGGAVYDLQTGQMRSLYNHDALGDYIRGYVYTYMGGDWSSFDTCFFPGGGWWCNGSGGGNDRAVAFHSAGRYRSVGNYGSSSANGSTGGDYWDYTISYFVDSQSWGSYTHFTGDSNGGIMGQVTSTMSSYAK